MSSASSKKSIREQAARFRLLWWQSLFAGRWGLLDRYIFGSLGKLFLLCIAALVLLVFSTGFLFELTEIWIKREAPLSAVLKIFLYGSPEIVVRTLPAAILFAVVLVFGMLSKNREMEAMVTGGVPLMRIARPAVALGCLVSVGAFVFAEFVAPPASRIETELRALYDPEIVIHKPLAMRDAEGGFVFADSHRPRQGVLNHVLRLRMEQGAPEEFATSVGGVWEERHWRLSEGVSGSMTADGEIEAEGPAPALAIDVGVGRQEALLSAKDPTRMTLPELMELIRTRSRGGLRVSLLLTELHFRFSVPVSCLVFVLLGLPLAVRFGRQERYMNIVMCFMIVSFYWGIMAVAKSIGAAGVADPYLGGYAPLLLAWSQNALFGAAGLLLIGVTAK